MREHRYVVGLNWTGEQGNGTVGYQSYSRDHEIQTGDKPVLLGSADPTFRGDPNRYNPEELLLAALSSCHMLWYLHLCSESSVVVVRYQDQAEGTMIEEADGGGAFREVVLRPVVVVTSDSDMALAHRLHSDAHRLCFIARSVNFTVRCSPTITPT
jgi:organic hydroperoxide reductase OsmC/OhrA